MSKLETKKGSLDKKQELWDSTRKKLEEFKKEEFKDKPQNKEVSISKEDVERFEESFYSGFEDVINRCKESGMTEEEEATIKGAVAKIVVKAKSDPDKYLEPQRRQGGKLIYWVKKEEMLKFFNEMPWNQREVFAKYDIM